MRAPNCGATVDIYVHLVAAIIISPIESLLAPGLQPWASVSAHALPAGTAAPAGLASELTALDWFICFCMISDFTSILPAPEIIQISCDLFNNEWIVFEPVSWHGLINDLI